MRMFEAVAEKREGWWIITIPELDQATRTKRRSEIEDQAEALAAAVLDGDNPEVRVSVSYVVPEEVREDWEAAREDQRRAQELSLSAADRTRAVLARLRDSGYSGRDIADVLGISFQRVSQILKAKND